MKVDNTFEIRGVHGPRRLEIEKPPSGWALKSVFANGVDVTDRALPFGEPQQSLSDVEVVLTNHLTELAGGVTDARGDTTRNYTLLIFRSIASDGIQARVSSDAWHLKRAGRLRYVACRRATITLRQCRSGACLGTVKPPGRCRNSSSRLRPVRRSRR